VEEAQEFVHYPRLRKPPRGTGEGSDQHYDQRDPERSVVRGQRSTHDAALCAGMDTPARPSSHSSGWAGEVGSVAPFASVAAVSDDTRK
jgi:hypothetical protein